MNLNFSKNGVQNTQKLKPNLLVTYDDDLDLAFDINSFYKISSRNRTRRTSYNTYFTPIFKQEINETRIKQSLNNQNIFNLQRESLFAYDSSERFKTLTKSKHRLNIEERNRISNKNSNLKKENNNSSINSLELLQKRNNFLINSLKKNYDFFK